jgi:DNA-binding phage protein
MRRLVGREPHRLEAMRTEDPRVRGGEVSGQTHSQDSKAELRAALQLDSEPTDEIEDVVINATTGELLAQARGGRTLASIGEKVGVTRARIQQLERSTNIEIATFVRVAKACGYEVSVRLRPLRPGLPPLSAVLGAPDAT